MSEPIEMIAIIKGHVQGVGFRAMVMWLANQLHLKGTVRNVKDGTVEVCAQGSKDNLDRLLLDLRSNRGRGFVESVTANYSTPQFSHSSFQIID